MVADLAREYDMKASEHRLHQKKKNPPAGANKATEIKDKTSAAKEFRGVDHFGIEVYCFYSHIGPKGKVKTEQVDSRYSSLFNLPPH